MKRKLAFRLATQVFGFALLVSTSISHAQEFPSRPISLIVPFGPGGATDIVARFLVEEVGTLTKQPVVIFNKPGASATLGTSEAFRAKPDGYTLLLGDNISTVFQPRRMTLPYTGPEDFQPIVKVADIPNVLVVREDSKWRNLDEFVAEARAKPGSFRISTAGHFTGTDLNMRELNQIAGIDTTMIPVSAGTGAAVTLLLGGHVEAVVASPAAVVSFAQAKKVRPLAVFSNQRIALFPDVPTTAELGYKTTMRVMVFVSAPKNLDKGALQKLETAFSQAVQTPRFRAFAQQHGYQLDPLGPEALGKELTGWRTYFTTLSQQLGPERPN
jgi:tripartite-type tricarboxylate transporter receptor subunit TctC